MTTKLKQFPSLFLLTIFVVLTGCNNSDSDNSKRLTNNVAIFFHDNSLNKENSSIQLFIDNKLAFQSDSIAKQNRQDFELKLDTGKHFVSVQTTDKSYPVSDIIHVKKENQRYLMSITFNYNPPLDWWTKHVIDEAYNRTLIKNKLKPDTIITWLQDSLKDQIEREKKTSPSTYKPSDRYFKIAFEEQPLLE